MANERIRVVVVDDLQTTRASITRLLTLCDEIQVVGEAVDGASAVHACRRLQPDCVLMDVNMEGIDGLQATRLLRNLYPDIVVIVMSVIDSEVYRENAFRAGASDYIVKPFTPQVVLQAISRIRPISAFE